MANLLGDFSRGLSQVSLFPLHFSTFSGKKKAFLEFMAIPADLKWGLLMREREW